MDPSRAVGAGLLGVVAVAGVVALAATSAEPADAAINGNTLTALSQCQREVAVRLGSPPDAAFAETERTAVTRDAGRWRFQGYVDVPDPQGVPARVRWVCTADPWLNDTFAIDARIIG